MLKLSRPQLEAMTLRDPQRLVDTLLRYVRRNAADMIKNIDPISLREMVEGGVVRARSHGLSRLDDLALFIGLMFEIGPSFDEQADLHRLLDDPAIPPDQKMANLLARAPDAAWDEAEKRRDSLAWFPELVAERRGAAS